MGWGDASLKTCIGIFETECRQYIKIDGLKQTLVEFGQFPTEKMNVDWHLIEAAFIRINMVYTVLRNIKQVSRKLFISCPIFC